MKQNFVHKLIEIRELFLIGIICLFCFSSAFGQYGKQAKRASLKKRNQQVSGCYFGPVDWATGVELGLGSGLRTDSKWLNQNTGSQAFLFFSITYKSVYITVGFIQDRGRMPILKIDSSFSNRYSNLGYSLNAGYGLPISRRFAIVPGLGFSHNRMKIFENNTPPGKEIQSFHFGSFTSPVLGCAIDYAFNPPDEKPKYLTSYDLCLRLKYEASLVNFSFFTHFQHFLSLSVVIRMPVYPNLTQKRESNPVPENTNPATPSGNP